MTRFNRYIPVLLGVLLISLTACGTLELQINGAGKDTRVTAPVPTSPSFSPLSTAEVPTTPPDPTSDPTLKLSPTPWPATPTPVSTPWPSTLTPEPGPQRIRFATGATSATVNGRLMPHENNQRYILRALAGQTLEVDIAARRPLVLDVSGQNGTVLALERMDGTAHWESRLPTTQDYLIQLTALGETSEDNDYELTLTIPSLTEPTPDFSIYHNAAYGFEVRYPSDFRMGLSCPPVTAAGIHEPVVSFRLVGDRYYAGTNLLDACVTVSVDRSEAARSTCTGLQDPQEDHRGQQEINGLLFSIVSRGGVAAGHLHEARIYRTLQAETCYEITLFLHYASMGVYTPGTVSELDKDAVMSRLDQVLKSITIIE